MSYSVVTNYKTTLSAPMSDTQLTVPVNSIVTKDTPAVTLTTADMGDGWYLVIAPGTNSEEVIKVTAITPGSGVAGIFTVPIGGRGLAYSGQTDDDVAGNAKNHNPGEIVILSNVKNVYDRLVDRESDEDIDGIKNFLELPTVPLVPTDPDQVTSKSYVDGVAFGAGLIATTTNAGYVELATQGENNAGTNMNGSNPLVAQPGVNAVSVQNAAWTFAADAQASDAYAITLVPAVTAYAIGQQFVFTANTVNTGAASLNVNGLGAKTIKKNHDQDLENGDIEAGSVVLVTYDGTNFQMLNQQSSMPTTAILNTTTTFFTDNPIGVTAGVTYFNCTFDGPGTASNATSSGFLDDATYPILSTPVTSGTGTGGDGFTFFTETFVGGNSPIRRGVQSQNNNNARNIRDSSVVWTDGSAFLNLFCTGTSVFVDSSSALSFVGTAPTLPAPLGFDKTNVYSLFLDSTTRIRRYSGSLNPGTTLTLVDTITLDTAVSQRGFVFDDVNNRYICVDLTGNVVRRFNSSGTTIDTVAIPDFSALPSPVTVSGLCIFNQYVYVVLVSNEAVNDAVDIVSQQVTLYPTTMKR